MPAANIQGALHVDRYLTNYSVSYMLDESNFIAGRAASLIPVQNQSDKFIEWDRGFMWRDEMTERPLGGRPNQVSMKVNEGSYNAREWATEIPIDDRQRANTDSPINLDEGAAETLSTKAMIRADRIWAERFFVPNVWTTLQVGTASTPGTNQFLMFDDVNSDPIGVIDAVKDGMHVLTGKMPNTLVLGAKVKTRLRTHPDITDRIKFTQIGIAEEGLLASVFGVTNLLVARGVFNSADEGAPDNFTYTVDQTGMWLGYIEPNPGLNKPTAIANFAWQGLVPGQTNSFGGVITRGRDDRAYSDWFHVRQAYDLKLVAPDLGAFFQSVVSQ